MIFLGFVGKIGRVIVQQYGKQNILKCIIYQIKWENIRNMNIAEAFVIFLHKFDR